MDIGLHIEAAIRLNDVRYTSVSTSRLNYLWLFSWSNYWRCLIVSNIAYCHRSVDYEKMRHVELYSRHDYLYVGTGMYRCEIHIFKTWFFLQATTNDFFVLLTCVVWLINTRQLEQGSCLRILLGLWSSNKRLQNKLILASLVHYIQ